MFSNFKDNKSGFTLVELIIYIALMGVLLLALSGFFGLVLRSRVKTQSISEVEQQGIQVMQIISQTVRNSTTINSPSTGASGASLSVAVATPAKSPTVFDLSGGAIEIKEGAGAAVALTNSRVVASDLSFYNLTRSGTKGIVRIQFTLTRLNLSNRNELNYSKIFYATAALR